MITKRTVKYVLEENRRMLEKKYPACFWLVLVGSANPSGNEHTYPFVRTARHLRGSNKNGTNVSALEFLPRATDATVKKKKSTKGQSSRFLSLSSNYKKNHTVRFKFFCQRSQSFNYFAKKNGESEASIARRVLVYR